MRNNRSTLAQILRSADSIIEGLGVTWRELFRKPITEHYPDVPSTTMPSFRAIPVLLSDPETGKANCTACGLCARTCPLGCITVEGVKGEDGKRRMGKYSVDMSRCMVCGLCVESCNFNALAMSNEFELAAYNVDDLIFHEDRLMEMGKRISKERAAAKKEGEVV